MCKKESRAVHYFLKSWDFEYRQFAAACSVSISSDVCVSADIADVTCKHCLLRVSKFRADKDLALSYVLKKSLQTVRTMYAKKAGLLPEHFFIKFKKMKKQHKKQLFKSYATNPYYARMLCVETNKSFADKSSIVENEWYRSRCIAMRYKAPCNAHRQICRACGGTGFAHAH